MRLFIAIPVPSSPSFARVQHDIVQAVPGARLTAADDQHITVRFLGEVFDPQPVMDALAGACRGRPPLPAVIEGVGTFPGGRFPADKHARVVWAGVRAAGIEALANAVVAATADFGVPPESRPFVAHVTLARLPRPTDLRDLVERHRDTLFAQGDLDRVVLFRSHMGSGTARHEPLLTIPLGPAGRRDGQA